MLLEAAIVVSGLSYLLLTKDKKPAKVKISKPWVLSDITGDGLRISKTLDYHKFSNEHCLVVALQVLGNQKDSDAKCKVFRKFNAYYNRSIR